MWNYTHDKSRVLPQLQQLMKVTIHQVLHVLDPFSVSDEAYIDEIYLTTASQWNYTTGSINASGRRQPRLPPKLPGSDLLQQYSKMSVLNGECESIESIEDEISQKDQEILQESLTLTLQTYIVTHLGKHTERSRECGLQSWLMCKHTRLNQVHL